jgi:hypothetical protein
MNHRRPPPSTSIPFDLADSRPPDDSSQTIKSINFAPGSRLDASERRVLTERAALNPRIHRELWDRWRDVLPGPEVRRYLTHEHDPPFNEKGVIALIAEYQKTVLYMGLVGAGPGRQGMQDLAAAIHPEGTRSEGAPASSGHPEEESFPNPPPIKENEIKVVLEHNHLRVSAFVDRDGLRKLLKILEANRPFLENPTG